MARLVEKTYGQALFDLSLEENKIDGHDAEVRAAIKAFEDNPELLVLLTHPQVSKEEKIQLVINSFKDFLTEDVLGFLTIIIKAGRQAQILPILNYFIDIVKAYKRIGCAYVTSAAELSDEQKEAVKNRLLEITDNVEYEMHFSVDQSLLGGMIIRIGDKVVDSSIKTKLNTLSKSLLRLQLSE